MLKVSDAHHFRKTIAGLCMLVAPLVLLVAMVVHPERKSDEGAQLAVIAGNMDAWFASHLMALVAVTLAVPAVLGLMHMLRGREVAYGHIGGGMAMLGLIATTGVVAIDGFVGWQAVQGGGDPAQMTALFERLYDSTGVMIPFFLMSMLFGVGMVALAMGLYRARAVQSYTAVMIAAASVMLVISGPTASGVLAIVGSAVLLVGLGSVGRMVLAETDEEWEHTPEYKGFRPLAGMR